jgi:hypothetical protein
MTKGSRVRNAVARDANCRRRQCRHNKPGDLYYCVIHVMQVRAEQLIELHLWSWVCLSSSWSYDNLAACSCFLQSVSASSTVATRAFSLHTHNVNVLCEHQQFSSCYRPPWCKNRQHTAADNARMYHLHCRLYQSIVVCPLKQSALSCHSSSTQLRHLPVQCTHKHLLRSNIVMQESWMPLKQSAATCQCLRSQSGG